MRVRWILSAAGFSTLLLASGAATAVRSGAPTGGPPRQQQEEQEDYYRKWLREDVLYVITPQEKDVFQKLTNDDERDQFIEQFWLRRDPDPRTPANEFKLEHYRRIAYANENFSAGWPGWMTDRGKIYIIHGPPDEIEELPSGGEYERTLPEGGGRTSVFPYQKWRYRYLEGVGTNVEVEFVDRDFSGIYRLALSPEEKDAFLHVPNAGFTAAEELGLAERRQRPYFAPHGSYPLMNYREQDSAFARYERFVDVQLNGPYAKWHHTHSFHDRGSATLIRDRVVYRLPFGRLGHWVAGRFVAQDVRKIFDHRSARTAELLCRSK